MKKLCSNRLLSLLLAFILAVDTTGCSHRNMAPPGSNESAGMKLSILNERLTELSRMRESDSLLSIVRSLFHAEDSTVDIMARLCAGVHGLQEFLYTEELDSARLYMSRLSPYEDLLSDSFIAGSWLMQSAFYKFKVERDFPEGIRLLISSCDKFGLLGDTNGQATALVNIVQFFYIRGDLSGLEYAERAYTVARSIPDDKWINFISVLSMAQMLSLTESPDRWLPYVAEADSLCVQEGFKFMYYWILLMNAKSYGYTGNNEVADSLFMEALKWAESYGGEPAGIRQVCLEYGMFLQKNDNPAKALIIYQKGLDAAGASEAYILTEQLLLHISECAAMLGDPETASAYQERYMLFSDSLSINDQDREIERFALRVQKMEQEIELQSRELRALRAEKRTMLMLSAFIIAAVTAVSLWITGRRRKKMYETLIDSYRKNILNAPSQEKVQKNSHDAVLWSRIESFMNTGKLYRRKDLTLEALAEEVGTNRTYLSKTINGFSGTNFNNYVDRYRIKEAVGIIENSKEEVPLKQIADYVGYNTLSVFYKAFSRQTGLPPGRYRDEIKRHRRSSPIF